MRWESVFDTLRLSNKGATEISFVILDEPSLKDSTGQTYSFSQNAAFASGSSFSGGNIAPGDRLNDQVGFEVPENSSGFIFFFMPVLGAQSESLSPEKFPHLFNGAIACANHKLTPRRTQRISIRARTHRA